MCVCVCILDNNPLSDTFFQIFYPSLWFVFSLYCQFLSYFSYCDSFIRLSNIGIRDFERLLLDYFSKLPINSKHLKKCMFSNGIWSSLHITECNNINKSYSLTYESIPFPIKPVRKRILKQAYFPMY